jgi:uncharacterized protein
MIKTIMTSTKNVIKKCLWLFLVLGVLLQIIFLIHAYKFTHFNNKINNKTKSPNQLSFTEKLTTIILGVNNPRPKHSRKPTQPFETITLHHDVDIECWLLKTKYSKGTIILFHGYSGDKSKMLDRANIFIRLGYHVMLVDFMGSGGSGGNQTTIGFKEAEQVKKCFDVIAQKKKGNIYLFGTSMGAVAIMKAIHDYKIEPDGIILECPFGTMYQTVSARFRNMNLPVFPAAGFLVFWGGVINGFWAFNHNPISYASSIKCPTLLMHGAKDETVSKQEIMDIFKKLRCEKKLHIYKNAGHVNYLQHHQTEWTKHVSDFLQQLKS